AAGRIVATALGAGEPQVLAQCIEQKLAGLDRQFVSTAIDAEFDEFFFHKQSAISTQHSAVSAERRRLKAFSTPAPSGPRCATSDQCRRAWTELFRIPADAANWSRSASARHDDRPRRCAHRDRVPAPAWARRPWECFCCLRCAQSRSPRARGRRAERAALRLRAAPSLLRA